MAPASGAARGGAVSPVSEKPSARLRLALTATSRQKHGISTARGGSVSSHFIIDLLSISLQCRPEPTNHRACDLHGRFTSSSSRTERKLAEHGRYSNDKEEEGIGDQQRDD